MLTNMQFSSIEQLNDSQYFRTPLPVQNSYHRLHAPTLVNSTCSAYFITRVDLNDYTLDTLKQIVDRNVSGPKSKGLKVNLSLPDEGFIIENVLDSNQSWMYKTSELLYFWRDSFYRNLIIVITLNRSKTQQQGPFSASIFRLRGNDSVQLFLQRAQQFFGQLPSKNSSKSIENSLSNHNLRKTESKKSHRKQTHLHHHHHHHSHSNTKKTEPKAEFTPEKSPQTGSIYNLYNRRTYSETTVSSDSQKSNSKKNSNDDNEEKLSSVSNTFSNEYVLELVRELKALRSEIASLKIDQRKTPTRSISTSPITVPQQDIDLDKQISNNKRKNEQINTNVTKRTFTEVNQREEVLLKPSSRTNGHSVLEDDIHQPTSYPSRIHSKSKKDPSSTPMETEPSLSVKPGEVVSFRSSFEDTIPQPPENIYENIPIVIPATNNQDFYYNTLNTKTNDTSQVRVTLEGDHNSQEQQQYLSKLFGPENGISLLIPAETLEKKVNHIEEEEEEEEELTAINNHPNIFHQVIFANRLTNPSFNVDRQLLANTIANQFGIDSHSPYLEKLIENQHLFVAHKRTFANMVWQMTSEEERVMCSSPIPTSNSIEKPAFKTKKSSRSLPKGQRISWDSVLD